jgi:hypothetical protein
VKGASRPSCPRYTFRNADSVNSAGPQRSFRWATTTEVASADMSRLMSQRMELPWTRYMMGTRAMSRRCKSSTQS